MSISDPFALSLSKGQAELVEAGFVSAQHKASTSLSQNGYKGIAA